MLHQIFKELGQTPLEAINVFKERHNSRKDREYEITKISYAGRLDPMAKGLLIALTNELCNQQNDYHNLEKEYYFDVIIGFSTDTLDILGVIKNISESTIDIDDSIIDTINKHVLEIKHQEYPHYSSVRVNGKPLWQWAKEGKLDTLKIPSKEVKIYMFDFINQTELTETELKQQIFRQISSLKSSNFRQTEIIEKYNDVFNNPNKIYKVLKFRALVSPGVYIRTLTETIGNILGVKTTAMNITRTKIGF